MEQLTLHDLIGYWEFHNRTEGKSQKTIDWYNHVLGKFECFLQENGDSLLIEEIGEPQVRAFIRHLQLQRKWESSKQTPTSDQLVSPGGIENRLRAMRAFFNWLHREEYTDDHRMEGIGKYKVPKRVIDVLTEDEMRTLLGACNVRTHAGARDHAILSLMLDAGPRLSEVAGLATANVALDAGQVKVFGKGSKERILPIGTATQRSLWRYQHHFRPEPIGPDMVFFLTLDGKPLGQSGVRLIIKRLAKRSGVERLHPHLCRHTFATQYLLNGGDVFSLQQILGHTTLEMARIYVTLASTQVAVQHRKYSPMDLVAVGGRSR